MRELIIILIVLAIFVALFAFRYRKQIMAAVQVWRMLKKMRAANRGAADQAKPIGDKASSKDVELVRCARCGSWKPRDEALKFSRGTFYCSSACVNEALNVR